MKNTLHSPLFCLSNFYLKFNKKLLFILLFGTFLFTSNLAHAQLPIFDDFESGFGNWNDGGGDCFLDNNGFINGNDTVLLRDNSGVASSTTSDIIDLSSYTSVQIEFLFTTRNFANGEDFFVMYDDGTGFTTIATYTRGINFVNSTTYSISLTLATPTYNLTNNARFRIQADASGNGDRLYIDDINITETLPPPANDDCANAVSISPNSVCTFTSGTTTGASQSFSGCAGTADDDVWFSFVATATSHTITVDPSTMNDAVFQVYNNSCSGTGSIACVDNTGGSSNEFATIPSFTIGNTYYIRVYSYYGGTSEQGDFEICVVEPCTPSTADGTTTLGCPSVDVGGLGLSGSTPPTLNCTASDTTLEATYLELGDTSSYSVESIAYSPPFQFQCLANPVSVNLDDVWSPVISLPFDFCFYDNTYDEIVIGSNGVISFDTSLANTSSGWDTRQDIPNIENTIGRYFGPSIYGVHHDVDPSAGGEIGYQLITLNTGCRALVAAWNDVPMFADNSLLYTGMIVFYEDTNIIEVYIKEKRVLNAWNNGNASVGIQADDTEGLAAPGRNTRDANWTTFNEAWRFVPSGASITELKWYENSVSVANEIIDPTPGDNQIVVSPSSNTTYFAEVTYTLCDGSTIVETNDTTVTLTGNKTWNGSVSTDWNDPNNWTPVGVPVITNCITIPITGNDPVMSGVTNANGYSLEIMDGATLTQQSNSSLTIEDVITIEPTGDLEVRDDASLIQITDVVTNLNTGDARVQRQVTGVDYFDYVYWSSPVDAFNVEDISPGTPSFAIYEWTPTVANGTAGQHGSWFNTLGNMPLGKGYIVRGLLGGSIANTVEFEGTLNNGQISFPISRGTYNGADYMGIGNTATADDDNWNLLGNPYPSAISLTDFVTANPAIDGTLYFWRHLTPTSSAIPDPFHENYLYNYSSSDYLAENGSGSVPPGFDDDLIASGQGFFALMLHSAATPNTVTFSNSMRDATYDNNEFYRSTNSSVNSTEKHRIWLDLVDDNTNTANSILVGYIEGATDDIDRLYDGRLLKGSGHKFYSIVSDQDLVINGKGLPFNDTDIIPIGYQTLSAGNYTITINSLDGLFNNTTQDIFIEDTELNIIHNLRNNPYSFTTEEGTYNDRFKIKFTQQVLSISDQDIISNLEIKSIDRVIDVTSTLSVIKTFELFDLTGRTIHKNLKVDDTNYEYQNRNLSNGAYIVQVSLANGSVVSKKVVI
ncbi:CHU large protein; uncharacterized [Flavobacteriales bacterium ALC-1]|nr:CHU large protein; uncharacterized [Flavobacteriales bacterium ALC-1]